MKITLSAVCFLSASVLLGCSGSGFEDGGSDSADDGQSGPATFHLLHVPVADTCGGLVSPEVSEIKETPLTMAKDGKSFAFKTDDTEISCKIDGEEFTCDPVEAVLDEAGDIQMTLTLTYAGGWTSPDRMVGAFETKIRCTGDDCSPFKIEMPDTTLPCESRGIAMAYRTLPESFRPDPAIKTYQAEVAQGVTTCGGAFAAPLSQTLTIESQDGNTAKVTSDDGQGVPHECVFEGKGRTTCKRQLLQIKGVSGENNLVSSSVADLAWTAADKFEGSAFQLINCADGADCSGSSLGDLPCVSYYLIDAKAK